MANASDAHLRAMHPVRPRMPHRTLSSSLRLYSSPLVPRVGHRVKSTAANGALSPTHETHEAHEIHEANETDSLLRFSPHNRHLSYASFQTGSVATGFDDQNEDVEAEQSDEQADSDGLYPPNCCWTTDGRLPKRSDLFGNQDCDVYGNIHRIRREIISSIDDPYSLDQLKAPRMNISVVRPLVDKFYEMQDLSIVYCLLVNRAQFIREQSFAQHHHTVNLTRALLCELLAEKVLRRYNENNPGPRGLLKLANILVFAFEPFQGASDEVIKDSSHATISASRQAANKHHHKLTALEIAIISESKSFLANTACQKVVDAIYRGKVVYSPSSYIDIIPDRWKRRPISLYDPRRAPILNQYRLVVPRTRNWLEVIQFIVLLALYITVMAGRETRHTTKFGVIEIFFEIYAFGWILDQFASILEHGWQVYTQNLWSFLDVMFSALFMLYFGLRMRGLHVKDPGESDAWAIAALDVLSCAAPVLIPRLAFNIMSENMLFLSLRAMMGDFITLTALAFWCFAGFLLSLKWLHNGLHDSLTISKWMIFVWFGLDGTGIDQAHTFHPILGPTMMILFAFLGNTLFLTILVSMLSNTFSMIAANAVQEIQYRRTVLTFMGVKSDSLFAFMPPFNLMACFIFGSLKWILTPRMFHSVNVFIVRVVNFPTLVLLSWYERNTLWVSSQSRYSRPKRVDWRHQGGPRVIASDWWSQTLSFWDFSSFSAHGDIQAVFDSDPPEHILDDDANDAVTEFAEGFNDLDSTHPTLGKQLNNRIHAQFKMPFPTRTSRQGSKMTTDSNTSTQPTTPRKPTPHSPLSTNPTTPEIRFKGNTSANPSGSNTPRRPKSRKRLSTSSTHDAALRAEFHDSEDEQERHNRRKSRADTSRRKRKQIKRKDSLFEYDDANLGALEANARLGALEGRLGRIEHLLLKVVESADADIESVSVGAGMAVSSNGEETDEGMLSDVESSESDGNVDTDAEVQQQVRDDIAPELDT